jgi:RNA-directed DNA polymerase
MIVRYEDKFVSRTCGSVRSSLSVLARGSTKKLLENEVKPLVEQFLRDRGLQLSPEKTCVTPIEQGFDFLGQHLRKFSGKLLIQPSKKNTHSFLEKVRELIRRNCGFSQTVLIRQLNPVGRGWANYHRHVVVNRAFATVEWVLWHSLW